ncbi:MAG: packaged DNA stabilization protein [Pseudomonadota bacterium]
MQIPILNGIYTDEAADFRSSYPRNLVPVPKDGGISKGYLRPADGIVLHTTGASTDRGGINWRGACYRVIGTSLVIVADDGTISTLGAVAAGGQVTFDYSFDRLGVSAGGNLYYWDGATLTQVTDPDLGLVVDMLWVDGYFMTTDGVSLVVTELNAPTVVNPLKYGSSEVDPDRVVGLLKLRNEVYAMNRYTIEVFNNVGGALFPFERNTGAQISRGVIGTYAAAVYFAGVNEAIAFLGSARNEPPAVWLGVNSQTGKISTREIDTILQGYTEAELELVVMEARIDKSHQMLYMHLPDQTLVYDGAASAAVGEPVWFHLVSSLTALGQYRARNLVWCYNKWLCGDPTSAALGYLVDNVSSHYGDMVGWEFGTSILYNEGFGIIIHQLELVCLPGRVALGDAPVVWTSFSLDGELWSMEIQCPAGRQGDRARRLTWLQQGAMESWRVQRFRGTSDVHASFARLEAKVEPLYA